MGIYYSVIKNKQGGKMGIGVYYKVFCSPDELMDWCNSSEADYNDIISINTFKKGDQYWEIWYC